ncbi:Protein O-linked-mannose beta-1,4-N-acetylglucosaminyltransferase 2 [Phlyctochytrium planicorne]|nr:Protein O-linked-mannose beta-1,4-N-acetylglucosaminyltransferase 2 [Phlyctochytrium planicorne]
MDSVDITVDPAKNAVEFSDWGLINEQLEIAVSNFLRRHGFLENETTHSEDNDSESCPTEGNMNFVAAQILDYELGTKARAGYLRPVPWDGEDLIQLEDQISSPKKRKLETLMASKYRIDPQSGNTRQKPKNRITLSSGSTSKDKGSSNGGWANSLLKNWSNPVFNTSKRIGVSESFDSSGFSNRGNYAMEGSFGLVNHKEVSTKIQKQDLLSLHIIGQIENKFIAATFQRDASCGLLLIDQHAADERIILEKLTEDLFQNTLMVSSSVRSANAQRITDVISLDPPMLTSMSSEEAERAFNAREMFMRWGIGIGFPNSGQQRQRKSDAQVDLPILMIPKLISDRCITNPDLVKAIIFEHMYLISTQKELENECPKGIMAVLHSKACRSAVMFGDPLSRSECFEITTNLQECAFPFQCAHGRPSMTLAMFKQKEDGSIYKRHRFSLQKTGVTMDGNKPPSLRMVSNFRQRGQPSGGMSPTTPTSLKRETPLASIRRRTDSNTPRSCCPSRGTIMVGALVLGAFALGLYISGLAHLIIDVGQIAKPGLKDSLHGHSTPTAAPEEIAKAVKVVEDEWRKKYNALLIKLGNNATKEDLNSNYEVKSAEEAVPEQEPKVNEETHDSPDSFNPGKEESSKNKQMEDMIKQSEKSGSAGKKDENDDYFNDEQLPVSVFPILPSSSVWCSGSTVSTRSLFRKLSKSLNRFPRTCKFRNLCYNPQRSRWFVLKAQSSVFEGMPEKHMRTGLLEAGTVAGHPWVRFYVDEVSPFSKAVQNLNVRYEKDLHFMAKRLHPHNIMHNLHDDVVPLFHLIKHYVGKGEFEYRMPFSLDTHRLLFIDPYDPSESTRPFQYLTNRPLRFLQRLEQDKDVITCFRDAIVGSTKLTTWYQYGFVEPQGPLHKEINGLHVREVSDWFVRRLGLPLGEDELPEEYIHHTEEWEAEFDRKHPISRENSVDFEDTDLIIIMARRRNRLILNEEDLRAHLEATFKLKAIFVRNEDHTFEEQIKLMRRARVVLAMHGSILIMGIFCRRGTVIIEMFPYAVPSENYTPYKTMSELPGMNLIYRAWENKHLNTSITHDNEDRMVGGINHLPEKEQEEIRNSNTVPAHICCTNPYWLYRIYQDTIVNLKEVAGLIADALKESRTMLREIRKKNWEYINLLPPVVGITEISCLEGEDRKPGTLWAAWELPWNGAKVDKWVVKVIIEETHEEQYYYTTESSIFLPGFKSGSEISFTVKGVVGDKEQEFGSVAFCVV